MQRGKPIIKARPAPAADFCDSASQKNAGPRCLREGLRLASQIGSEAGAVGYNAPKTFLISELAWPMGSFLMARSSVAISPNRPSSALAVT